MKISDCEVDYVLKQKAIIKRFLNPFSFNNIFSYYWCRCWVFFTKMQNNCIQRLFKKKFSHFYKTNMNMNYSSETDSTARKESNKNKMSKHNSQLSDIVRPKLSILHPTFYLPHYQAPLVFGLPGKGDFYLDLVTRTH